MQEISKQKNNKLLFFILIIMVIIVVIVGIFIGKAFSNKEEPLSNNQEEPKIDEKRKTTYDKFCFPEQSVCKETLTFNGKQYDIEFIKGNEYALIINGIVINEHRFSVERDRLISVEILEDVAIVTWYNGDPVLSVYNLQDGTVIKNFMSSISVSAEFNDMRLTDSVTEHDDYWEQRIDIYSKELYKVDGKKIIFNGYLHLGECTNNSKHDIVSATYEYEYLGNGKFKDPIMAEYKTLEETGACKNIPNDNVTNKKEAKEVAQRVYEYAYVRLTEGSDLIDYVNDYEKEYNGELISCQKMTFSVLESTFTENAINHIKENYAYQFENDDNYYNCNVDEELALKSFLDTIFSATDSDIRELNIISFTDDTIVATGKLNCPQALYTSCDPSEEPHDITFKKVNGVWKIDTFN